MLRGDPLGVQKRPEVSIEFRRWLVLEMKKFLPKIFCCSELMESYEIQEEEWGNTWYDSPPPISALTQSTPRDGSSDPVVRDMVPATRSAPPQNSPPSSFDELGAIPTGAARVAGSRGGVHSNGRCRGKAFFLTYSQSSLGRERLSVWFTRQPYMKRVIVGREHHQDGNLHWHVLIEYEREKDIRAGSYFNIDGEHPNIKVWTRSGGSTYEQWFLNHWEYCKKEDPTPFVVGEAPTVGGRKRKRDDVFIEALDVCRREGVNEAMVFLEHAAPYDLVTKYDQIYRTMVAVRNQATNSQAPARSVTEFSLAPRIPENWHCLFVNGPTQLGKTAWARSLLPEATVVRHSDQLRTVDFSKGVIFDDFDIGHWPPTAAIHLLDWDEPSGINVKHAHVVIPAHTRKIFTHNGSFERWVSKEATDEQISAMRRRVHVVNIHCRLY